MGEELVVYDPEAQKIHFLNGTASLVWQLCDGRHPLPELAAALHIRFHVPADRNVEADVEALLAELDRQGLLADPCPARRPDLRHGA
ncbi:MAG: hypothetical protein KatS3mg050_4394 [Litorilinea sp.]|nr:MAG: hypothetical protein KatS3mg050_4394 [Litorilinea sp.]